MANNLFADRPAVAVAKETISFVDAGVTALNIRIIYKVAAVLRSYVPGRPINAVTEFEEGQGYYIIPKQDIDFSAILVPPLDVPVEFDNTEFDTTEFAT